MEQFGKSVNGLLGPYFALAACQGFYDNNNREVLLSGVRVTTTRCSVVVGLMSKLWLGLSTCVNNKATDAGTATLC